MIFPSTPLWPIAHRYCVPNGCTQIRCHSTLNDFTVCWYRVVGGDLRTACCEANASPTIRAKSNKKLAWNVQVHRKFQHNSGLRKMVRRTSTACLTGPDNSSRFNSQNAIPKICVSFAEYHPRKCCKSKLLLRSLFPRLLQNKTSVLSRSLKTSFLTKQAFCQEA